jgi:ketosteroid isomerase-like protein
MSDAVKDLDAAEAERRRALVAKDTAALERLFGDDLVHVHTNGVVQNKPEVIHHGTKVLDYKEIRRGDLNTRVFGDVAVVTGDMTNVMVLPGGTEPTTVECFVTQVWRKEADGWKAISFQAVRKPEPKA